MSFNTENRAKDTLRLVLVGLRGVGKSSSGNTILGRKEFRSEISSTALTLQSEISEGLVCGRSVKVVDTPGLFNTELSNAHIKLEMERVLTLCQPGPHVFLIVIQLGRFTEQERRIMEEMNDMFDSNVNRYSMVLFTYGDKLINKTIDQFITEDQNLQRLIHKCGGHFHVFNNVDPKNTAQVSELMEKIENQIKQRNKTQFYVKREKKFALAITMGLAFPLILVAFCMMTNKCPQTKDSVEGTVKLLFNNQVLIPVVLGIGAALWGVKRFWK